MVERPYWAEERWPATASVSVYLRPDARGTGLLLVRTNSKWGLPAGGLEKGELFDEGIRREVRQETGIDRTRIFFDPTFGVTPRYVICLPREDRTQIGLIFQADYRGPLLDRDGWEVHSDKADFAKPFRMRDLLPLIKAHLEAGQDESSPIYKPHFNFHLLLLWLVEKSKQSVFEERPKYVQEFLARIKEGVDHLEVQRTLGLEEWFYRPPCLVGRQDPEALKRACTLM